MSLNSTMVRLKRYIFANFSNHFPRSQFHYGSIKTREVTEKSRTGNKSQFHYGSIKTNQGRMSYFDKVLGLNSTMVRLKLLRLAKIGNLKLCLNSTMVRLKLTIHPIFLLFLNYLNSTMVRLKQE